MEEYVTKEKVLAQLERCARDPYHETHYLRDAVINTIRRMEAADVAPVRNAKWLKDVEGCLFCSNCHNTAEFNPLSMEQFKTPYCNVCGAKMDE